MTSDGSRTFAYDSENRLSNPAAPFHYDPLGRLAGVSASPGAPLALAYDNSEGEGLIAERLPGSLAPQRRHVFGPNVDEPLIWYEGSGTTAPRYLHADERGSIVAVTDGSGVVQNVNRYDEYGRTETSNSLWVSRFGYTGQRYFGGTGLYYYKARFYHPKLGRFMQVDPVAYDDQINLYAYVGNDPVNKADPDGRLKCSGFVECFAEVRQAIGEQVGKGARWIKTKLGVGVSAAAISTGIIARETRKGVRIPVYRVFDGERAPRDGRSWTLEDPREMSNWRDRLAVYPGWNKGTKVVQGWVTMQDMHMKNVLPGPGPNSTAGPQEKDASLGGGPYQGKGNEIIIPDAARTVKDKIVYPMCDPAKRSGDVQGGC